MVKKWKTLSLQPSTYDLNYFDELVEGSSLANKLINDFKQDVSPKAGILLSWIFYGDFFETIVSLNEKFARDKKNLSFINRKICAFVAKSAVNSSIKAGYRTKGYDEDRINLSMFVERMINNEPFEGCRIVDDYDNSYLLSVVMLESTKYPNKMAMNRVAQVKSQRSAGEFFNGAQSYSELIIKTLKSEEKGGAPNMVETIEIIKVNSVGFVKQMQLLTSFDSDDKMKIFVFYKELDKNSISQ